MTRVPIGFGNYRTKPIGFGIGTVLKHIHMSLRIGRKFSKKFLKNIEKSYKTVTNEEDIYYTFSPHNKNNNNKKMSSKTNNQNEILNTDNNNNNMEYVTATTVQELPSNSQQDDISHDTNTNDQPTQEPINMQVENSTFMEEDHIESNPNKGKSIDRQTNTPNDLPTRDSLNRYIEKSPPELKNIKIYELINNAINTLIEQKFKNLDNAVIQIMDIPYNYDTKMLLKHLANKTKSAIIDHKEIKRSPRRLPGHILLLLSFSSRMRLPLLLLLLLH
ncbi:hypothetical protein RhiirA5_385444 [Rhizophagus irregularis]|uniref:Uncharacterized protein n=1 Tax=Rhizophagus irregularis TaxID=588596 RepID=A0A2N0NNX6_9GLOM|nr:hypothetical protein RhiirA5_385444 [Rhizophagus irregularis]